MDNKNQMELVDDIIAFFQRLGASNELSDRNFDTGDFFSEEYCNFVFDLHQEVSKSGIKIESFFGKVLVGWKKVCTFAPANEETTSESTEERVL